MTNQKHYRQGDIILIRVEDNVDLNETPISNVLAEGEMTGHKHEVLDGTVHKHSWRQDIYVRSSGNTILAHPEHGHIKMDEGLFRFRNQREYDELSNRYVAD